MQRFLSELRRRRVFRVAVGYAVAGFVVLQVADLAIEPLRLPGWTMTLLWVIALAGLPVALALAWAFEMTPEGVRKDEGPPVAKTEMASPAAIGRRRISLLAIGIAAALVAFAAHGYLGGSGDAESPGPNPADAGSPRSIAVLPFANLSPDPENAYFGDGITEDILTTLAKVGSLQVTSRTSVMQYKETTKPIRQIGEELGVDHVLEGSVQRQGQRIRINAQLIDTRTDRHLWAERYDRDVTDLFAVQSEIAERIAGALQATLTSEEKARIAAVRPGDLSAYDLYLRGRQELYRMQLSGESDQAKRAAQLFRQALELDPDYALAHAGLASAYRLGGLAPRADARDSALAHAQRAVELGPGLSQTWTALAWVHIAANELEEARKAFERAVALNRSDADAIRGLGRLALDAGRLDEALRWGTRAVAIEPTKGQNYHVVADAYWGFGDIPEANRWLQRGVEVEPENGQLHTHLAEHHIWSGDLDAAEASLQKALSLAPNSSGTLGRLGKLALARGEYAEAERHYRQLARSIRSGAGEDTEDLEILYRVDAALAQRGLGRDAEAAATLDAVEERAHRRIARGVRHSDLYMTLARVHAVRGDADQAVHWLNEAVAHGAWEYYLPNDPAFSTLRGDPRFQEIVRELRASMRRQYENAERGAPQTLP